jgi:choline dehydrogenase-like flavoprotein
MSNYQIKESPEVYDAIVVGSGAGGGMAGYILAHAGLNATALALGISAQGCFDQ